METITVRKPSVPVMRKLRKGEPATLTKGDDFEVLVSANMAKKIKKAHDKGKGIRVKLETDAISEMEGKGVWGWLKRTTSRAVRGIESVAEPVAKIGGEATKLITGSSQIGKAAEATGRFLLGKDELAGLTGALGGLTGSELGAGAAIAVGQPELAPIGGIIGGVVGSAVAKYGTKQLEKATKPKRISKLTPEQAQEKLDKAQKAEDAKNEKERQKKEKERKKKEKEDDKQRKKQEAEMRKQAMKPYKGRDTSGRLKTFKTLTGATPDPVPVETMFQGTGSKKGSAEMKEKMAKLRAMRKKKMSGEGITMEIMEGTGKAYTREEWTKKLCEGENSLLEQKKKKIAEREAKKAKKNWKPPTQAEINEYPTLIDSLIDKMKELLKKIEQENNKFLGLPPLFSNKKEKKKFDLSKKKLTEELDKLNKVGRDSFGNLYLHPYHLYFKGKYGERVFDMTTEEWEKMDRDPYKNKEILQYDPLYDKAKEILDNFGNEERGITKEAPAPAKKAPAPAKKAPAPAKKAPSPSPSVSLTEAEKRRLKQAKEQLANMDRMRNMGIMMDEDQREEIEGTIRDLERKMTGKGMSGEGKHNEEEDERLDMKISDMAKKVAVIEKEHEKMTGKGKHDAPTIMPVTTMPVAGSEPKPVLGRDPATWSPVVSAPRPDFERGHNVPLRAGRYDGVSGSKLLGRRHQAFSSQPHSVNYGWKHSLGMPR